MRDFTKSFRNLVKIMFLGIIVLLIPEIGFTQPSEGGSPINFELSKSRDFNGVIDFDQITVHEPNVIQLKSEDVQTGKDGTPLRVGVSLPISASKETAGTWTDLPDGGRLWTLNIRSKGATAMTISFDDFYLAPGSKMFFYNENRKHVIGAFTSDNNLTNRTFATEMIQGESVFIEYYEPKFKRGESQFHINGIGYMYEELKGMNQYTDQPKTVNSSDACEVNINCTPVGDDWQDEKRGVAQITFLAGGSWYLCSGTLINNTENTTATQTPYFLTAFHCGAADASAAELNQWVFKFLYESPDCNDLGSEPATTSITGCSTVASGDISGGSDFFFLLLNSTPNASHQPYYNGWDISGTTGTGVGIHHPSGDIKKISTYGSISASGGANISGSIMAANSSWTVGWVTNANGWGVTEGGSSGSPLFNSNGLQIGTLTGGSSYCTDQTATDIYGRLAYHWDQNGGTSSDQLEPWLDPTSTGTTSLPGFDPFATAPPTVEFAGTPTIILQGGSVDFFNYSENSPTSHDWIFENGTPGTSTDINPTGVIYNVIGTHDVTLTSSNANGPTSLTKTDYIEVIDPASSFCDTLTQFCCNPLIYTSAAGYVGGTNEYDCLAIAEFFENHSPYNQVQGMRVYLADADNGTNPTVTFNVWDNVAGSPGSVIATLDVPMATVVTAFTNDGYIDINFGSTVDIPAGGFFAGFEVPGTPASGDTLAVVTNDDADSGLDSGYSLYGTSWDTYAAWSMSLSNAIFAFTCYDGSIPPVADFVGVPTRVAIGSDVQFNDNSVGTPATSWTWTFPGGTPDATNISNPLVTYSTLGFYDVSLSVSNANGTDNVTKTTYIEVYDPNATSAFTLDFEACTEFAVDDFDPWTTNDQDGGTTWGISGVTFPNSAYVGSLIAFNAANTTPPVAGWEPHGGVMCGAFINAVTADAPNDDWLISDNITLGNTSSFTFWAKSASATYAAEKFNVMVSTTDNAPGSFVNVSGGTITTTATWTEYTYDLSAYDGQAVHIAINCISNDQFALLIDDLEINSTYPPPVADFSADQTSVPQGGTVNFTDLTTASPTSWSWSFPGGTPSTSTVQNPSIVYNTIGTYQVELTATNSTGADTETKVAYIIVTEVPDNIVLWDFPNATDNNVADDGIAPNLTRTITGIGGITDIQYNAAGVATRSVGADGWAAGDASKAWQVDFETLGYGTLKLNFAQMSDNTRSPRDFKVQYSTNGTVWTDLVASYQLTEDVWSQQNSIALPVACEDQANVYLRWIMTSNMGTNGTQTVSSNQATRRNYMDNVLVTGLPLNAPPVAEFSANDVDICAGESVTFTDASTNTPTSWAWSFTGGTPGTSIAQNPVVTFNTAGTYQVELTATNGNGFDTETKAAYITVNPVLPASVAIVADQNNICDGTNVTFTATPTNGGTPTYQWKLNGVNVGTGLATYSNATLNDADAVTVVMTSSLTCVSGSPATSNAVNMTVNPILPVSVAIVADQNNICDGTNVTFTATPINGGTPTYQWLLNGANVGTGLVTYSNNSLNDSDVVTLEMTSSLTCISGSPATSNAVNMTINPILPASVAIVADQNNICDGTNVTFTATPTNGGTPTYQWKLNGGNVGTGLATYSNNSLNDSDVVTLEMNSSLTCVSGSPATSNAVNMTVNPVLPASVAIVADLNNICDGTNVTFTATPTNGETPTYQWKLNGVNVGTGLATYSNATLNDSDAVTVVMASSLTCVSGSPATSNAVNMTVNPILPVSVAIVADQNNICDGTNVTFTATPTNGGAPTYQWLLNGANVGTGLATYSNNSLNDSDVVTVEMTSSLTCISGSPATSNAVNMTVNPILPASVAIVADQNNICDGTNVTFTATPTNGGTPTYQWKLNGGNIGTGLATYSNNSLNDSDVITLEMNSSLTCVSGSPATSNAVNMTVNPLLPASVAIVADQNNICDGTNVTFTATPTNGGTPTYQWKLNGVNVGAGLATYSNATLNDADAVTLEMISSLTCVSGSPATSNAVNMTVNPILPVSVAIVADQNNICDGTNVTFTATPTNGGTPTYQWLLNGTNVGTGLVTYSNNSLNDSDVVTLEMTSSLTCISGSPATSNAVNMTVNPILPASVAIVADQNNICDGTNVTFTATPTNGGTPTYQWKLNGGNIGTGLATYSNNSLNDSDVVTLEMTSSLTCISGSPATSNAVNMTVNPVLPASIAIVADLNNICDGTNVTFTATPTNGGTPTYQWKLNGVNVGAGLATYSNATLNDADAVTLEMISSLTCVSGSPATSNAVNMTVNPILPVSVAIVADQSNICDGTNVTFTATPTNGGTPTYQWLLNGANVGTGLVTYSNNSLNDSDVVTVEMISSLTCISGSPATSNAVNMIVNPILPASVAIVADQNNICDGTNVTFTATPTNGGTPTYQWKLNGGNVGTGLATYSNNSLNDADVVTLEMISSLTCVSGSPATSNAVNMTVNPLLPVSVAIVADQNNICDGTSVTFTVTPTNGGTPTYQWKLNGVNVGTGLATYSNATLNDADAVTIEMISSLTCISGSPATSNAVNMIVNPILPASVAIVADQNNICDGTNVTFTATPTNGGTPIYQWLLNGANVGTGLATYSNNSLNDSDVVTLEMNSSLTCISGSPATSNAVNMIVNPILPASVAIVADQNNICDGTNVTFTATPTNGGTPTYQWKLNGGNVGTGLATYSNNSLNDSDVVTLEMASSLTCVSGSPATSNAVNMTVNPLLPASVAIVADQNNICDGTNVTFTATPTNGGTPTYQWKINGVNVGTGLATYSNATLNDADAVTIEMNSSLTCVSGSPATSNAVNMTVNPILPVSVAIVADQNNICDGTNITFTATPTNGGTPTYQWLLNGANVGTGIATYSNNSLNDSDVVTLEMNSSLTCISGSPATSNAVNMTVNLSPAITLQPANSTIGDGGSTSFSVTATGDGLNYQWQVSTDGGSTFNNILAAGANPTYANWNTSTLDVISTVFANNGLEYQCIITGTCPPAVTTTPAVLTVNSAPAITTQPLNTSACVGAGAAFNVIASGTITGYQWQVSTDGGATYNDILIAAVNPTYSNWNTPTLGLAGITPASNTNMYRCIVQGTPNAVSNSATLTVNIPPVVTLNPSNSAICEGDGTSFVINAIGDGLTYQWQVSTDGGATFNNILAAGANPTYATWSTNNLSVSGTINGNDGYMYQCVISGSCAPDATSNPATMTINPLLPISVAILADQNDICDGTNVTFTATPTNGGTPTYQWKINGTNVGTGLATYSNNSLNNIDVVTVEMISSLTCISGSPASSNAVNMIVNPNLPVSVAIVEDQNDICDGTTVTFNATPTNGGIAPSYDWLVNSVSVGAPDADSYSSNTLADGDVVEVVLTSSETCASGNPATSNAVNMTINPNLAVSVAVVEDQNDICDGTTITFNATPTNGGIAPSYDWLVNSASVGAPDTDSYSSNTLADGDVVEVVLTSSETCVTGNPANSNTVNMVVNPILTADVSIVADITTICTGSTVTFTATPVNGGTPSYIWYVNGVNIGAPDSPTYSTSTLNDGDNVYCEMTSSETCVTNSPATSNTVNITVNSDLPVSVVIAPDANPVCDAQNVTFSATPTNGGTTPSYDWLVNSVSVGAADADTYTVSTLNDTDVVEVVLTSSETCASGNPATSNAVNMTVNPNLAVSVAIVEDQNDICDGTTVTFNATPTNGGIAPSYDWLVNSVSVGAPDADSYSNNTLADGDVVEVVLTSSETCVTGNPANSNTVNMVVNPILTADVSIVADITTICAGSTVTFTATPVNGGTPSYIWYVNGVNVGALDSPTYSTSTLNDGDNVYCEMTSSETCVTNSPATSNTVNITVNSDLPVSVNISPDADPICNGSNVTFTAIPTNGGATPSYNWLVNSVSVGAPNTNTFTTNTLNDIDVVEVVLTSSESCASGNPATSNDYPISVMSNEPVGVLISEDLNDICNGTPVTFNATPTNGGIAPSYDWLVNSVSVGAPDMDTYSSSTLANGDVVEVVLTSSEMCVTGNPANSNTVNMVVNPILTADVSIVADITTICAGSTVTFTATPVNGGTPSYIWYVNGVNVGAPDSQTYSTSSLNDGDNVYCEMTSSEACVTNSPATSNTISITANTDLPVSVVITPDANPVCDAQSVTFSATPTNGGTTPSYDWLVNSVSVGAPDTDTYTISTLNDADVVEVILTSSESCASGNPATSNAVNMTVNTNLLVSVAIVEDLNNICDGTTVTFNATPNNGGIAPSYDWLVNSVSVGAPDADSYSSNTLADGDVVEVILTSSEMCVTGNPANSNTVNMVVNPILTADVSIVADITTICAGSTVTFTATPVNGATPSYIWYVNGVNVGAPDSPTYSNSTLIDGDNVYCEMTSSETCITNSPATSNTISITVNTDLPVSVIITPDANPVCDAQNVTFSATPTNGGTTPSYDWLVNSVSVGAPDANTFSSNTLSDGDVVEVILTSSESCASGNPATSNAVNMTVNANLPVSVAIVEDLNDICDGTTVTFNATPTNGGIAPSYDWLVNSVSVGAPDTDSYTNNTLADGDVVEVVLTSSETCVTGNPANSNAINMVVNPVLTADVSIVADITTICAGSTVTFTATPVNGGTPSYVWFVNGVNVGAPDSPTYSTSTLNDGDNVYCEMTSSETCVTNSPATSNTVTIGVNPTPIVPIVDVQCIGTGGAGVVTVTSPIGAEYTYSLDGITFQSEVQFIDVANGTYTLTVDQTGCTNVSTEFTIDCACDNPATLFIAPTSGVACNNIDFILDNNTFGGNATEVTVTHDGAGSLEQSIFTTSPFSIVYIPDASDLNESITITVTTDDPDGDLCDAISEQFVITVYEAPVVDLPETSPACAGEDFTYTLIGTYDYVLWMDAIEEQDFTNNYTFVGDYEVWVYVENTNCSAADTMTVVVDICDDITEITNGKFDVYPNPTRNNCQLSISDYTGELTYSILDIQGKEIVFKQLDITNEYLEEINVQHFVPGMYIIRLTTENETINYKLIKE